MTLIELGMQVLYALALFVGMVIAVAVAAALMTSLHKRMLQRRREKIRRLCWPCVHLHFSRCDGFACEPHWNGKCSPKTQECYYPSDY